MFYLTGIFYSIKKKIPMPYCGYLLYLNPMAYLITAARDSILYGMTPNLLPLILWFVLGIGLSIIGIRTIYRYENTYVKVMKH